MTIITDWKQEAERLKFDEGKSWTEVAAELSGSFPELSPYQIREKVRDYIRGTNRYKQQKTDNFNQASFEYKSDGSIVSQKFIVIRDGDEMTPSFILEQHGLDPSLWEVVNYKNNFWNTQIKGGSKQISYQSKLSAKPIKHGISFDEIDNHFAELDRKHKTPIITPIVRKGSLMAEVNIADLHLGKLCWNGDTGNNFDYKIARELFYRIINEICNELQVKPIEYITFVWANDFFNSDNIEQTTTAGTRQDTDVRWQKLFNVGVEMLVNAIDVLSKIAPIKTFWTPSNHDEVTGYHALKYLDAWFRANPNIEIDSGASYRKYQLYGNTLIGYTHGCKIHSNGTKEKASRLASLMPIEAREMWGQAQYCEMHVGHLHSEHMIQEINGVIVRRIASPTPADAWHTESGYIGSVRKAQTFIYDKTRGLIQTINTPI